MSTRKPTTIELEFVSKSSYEFAYTYNLDTAGTQTFNDSSFEITINFKDGAETFPLVTTLSNPHEVALSLVLTVEQVNRLHCKYSSYRVTETTPAFVHTWQLGKFSEISSG